MGIASKAMQFAGCLALMFGLSAEGLRPSVDPFNAECCCTKFEFTSSAEEVEQQKLQCQQYKHERSDRPFWYHGQWGAKQPRCCWTTRWLCNDFGGFSVGSVADYFSYAQWCPRASKNGTVF
ncbi:unnamed protein product [Symbiodinium natans]|uniref:Uncharacterized protein n=1 Tax=Symbiodinium natans TaxID=878477 RepID=A0A812MQD4_9DINO|nr:unnamed protein product [Symbiodinium natans]